MHVRRMYYNPATKRSEAYPSRNYTTYYLAATPNRSARFLRRSASSGSTVSVAGEGRFLPLG